MSDTYVEKILAEYEIPSTPQLTKLITTQSDRVAIPNKALDNFKYIPKRDFKVIHPDLATAKELTLFTLSNLSNTWTLAQHSDDVRAQLGFKRLYSKILEEQVKYDPKATSPYRKILDLLLKHGYIEVGAPPLYKLNGKGKATEYRLSSKYYGKGCHPYLFKSQDVIRMNARKYNENFKKVVQTEIGMNHLKMLTKVRWPSLKLVNKTISDAIKNGYTNKKGKRLVRLGKHSKTEYPQENYVYAEDYEKSFMYLKENMRVPTIKDEWLVDGELQFRIATCFTLMPKLLRELITIGDEPICENDFSALHPNITQMMYDGSNISPITHEGVATYLTGLIRKEIPRDIAKKEHLSFFNKKIHLMKQSPLWEYYWNNEKTMMENIMEEKITNEKGHKATCWRIFAVEVQLMERSIKRLNEMGVDVIYVYDALYSIKSEQETVRRVMNEVAQEMNILSRACSSEL